MTPGARVAVTGAGGRLGRALVERLSGARQDVSAWRRPAFDLDRPESAEELVERDHPSIVFHAAAWTDVDGCARDPEKACRRNADAVAALADACARRGASLVYISTNEVFDGARSNGRAYRETDDVAPLNAYGASKLAGERLAAEAYGRRAPTTGGLWVARTSWLFGPPGNDFPSKILAARDRMSPDEPLSVVSDEFGCPTYTVDLADGLARLVAAAPPGTYHLVNDGHASRFEWAAEVLSRCGRSTAMRPVSSADWERPSRPPAWGVLDASTASSFGIQLRSWRLAFGAYADSLCA